MTDHTLPLELQRTAALARIRAAKDLWTRIAVGVLKGDGIESDVTSALAELSAARAALADLDASNRGINEG